MWLIVMVPPNESLLEGELVEKIQSEHGVWCGHFVAQSFLLENIPFWVPKNCCCATECKSIRIQVDNFGIKAQEFIPVLKLSVLCYLFIKALVVSRHAAKTRFLNYYFGFLILPKQVEADSACFHFCRPMKDAKSFIWTAACPVITGGGATKSQKE